MPRRWLEKFAPRWFVSRTRGARLSPSATWLLTRKPCSKRPNVRSWDLSLKTTFGNSALPLKLMRPELWKPACCWHGANMPMAAHVPKHDWSCRATPTLTPSTQASKPAVLQPAGWAEMWCCRWPPVLTGNGGLPTSPLPFCRACRRPANFGWSCQQSVSSC